MTDLDTTDLRVESILTDAFIERRAPWLLEPEEEDDAEDD